MGPRDTGPPGQGDLLGEVTGLGSDLVLDRVIHRTISAGRRLLSARYGALGVLSPDAMLGDFFSQGADDARIGAPPQGHGILGALVHGHGPLRVDDIGDDPRSYGFPPGHPPMTSFLGVPIPTSSGIFGHLWLTDKNVMGEGPEAFTDDDVETAQALARAAGIVLDNARRWEQGARRQAWLESQAQIQEVLLTSTDRSAALRLVAARAREVASADFAGILLPTDDGLAAQVVAAEGMAGATELRYPLAGSLTGEVLRSGRPVVVDDLAVDEPAFSHGREWPRDRPELGPALFVPLSMPTGTLGVLLVASRRDQETRFALTAVQLVGSLAGQAALALERLRARDDRARLAVFEDRDRIARDLHDLVIQRLFATGLQLQTGARTTADDALRDRLDRAVDDLDATIAAIRTTIFELGQHASSLSGEVRGLLEQLARASDVSPVLHVHGPLDQGVPERIRPHLLAVLRESLSNVARHAHAAHVEVTLEVGDDIVATVTDDGVGIRAGGRRSGLRNLRQRAESLGGTLAITAPAAGGTQVTWRVPQRS